MSSLKSWTPKQIKELELAWERYELSEDFFYQRVMEIEEELAKKVGVPAVS